MEEIVNKVAASGIETIDLETFYVEGRREIVDVSGQLWQGLVLKEKDFREFVKTFDWSIYKDAIVGITCSTDAIVPTWAYMLVALAVEPYAARVIFGNANVVEDVLFTEKLQGIDGEKYRGARVVIKGCSNKPVPVNAFVMLAAKLRPFAKSIMYGEPCSTVPLYKAKS